MDVFMHFGHIISMDSAQVSINKQAHQVALGSLLQCLDSMNLEVQVVCTRNMGNFVHQVHKRSLAEEEFSALLILTYLIESHCHWLVPLGPL